MFRIIDQINVIFVNILGNEMILPRFFSEFNANVYLNAPFWFDNDTTFALNQNFMMLQIELKMFKSVAQFFWFWFY